MPALSQRRERGAMSVGQAVMARRLKEARLNCGLTQEEAARAVGVPRTAVVGIEAGKRSVSTLELSKLAKAFHRPVSYFFEEDAVGAADLVLAHRLPGYEDNTLVKEAVARCKDLGRVAVELETILDRRPRIAPPTYELPAPRRAEEAIEQGIMIAEEERRRLGLGFAPIADVSDLINTQGIWASWFPAPGRDVRAFPPLFLHPVGHHRQLRPRPGRKRFSHAHEYAHAILDRAMNAIVSTDRNSQQLIEKRANAFAAALLMPQVGVSWFLNLMDKGRCWLGGSSIPMARGTTTPADRAAGPTPVAANDLQGCRPARPRLRHELRVGRLSPAAPQNHPARGPAVAPRGRPEGGGESIHRDVLQGSLGQGPGPRAGPGGGEPRHRGVPPRGDLDRLPAGPRREAGQISGAKLVELAETAAYD